MVPYGNTIECLEPVNRTEIQLISVVELHRWISDIGFVYTERFVSFQY